MFFTVFFMLTTFIFIMTRIIKFIAMLTLMINTLLTVQMHHHFYFWTEEGDATKDSYKSKHDWFWNTTNIGHPFHKPIKDAAMWYVFIVHSEVEFCYFIILAAGFSFEHIKVIEPNINELSHEICCKNVPLILTI